MADLAGIVERLSALTVIESAELSKMLEERWGVSAARPTGPLPLTGIPEMVPEPPPQSEFDVILTGFGDKKIPVMKEVRTITGLDLKSAQTFLTELPKPLKEAVSAADAAKLKALIEGVGGTVEVR